MKTKVILGKSRIEKKIKLPVYMVTNHETCSIMTRFSIRDGIFVSDKIVCRYRDDDSVEEIAIGRTLYEKIDDAWDLSGWSEYTFDSGLAKKNDWDIMRKLAKLAYVETGE